MTEAAPDVVPGLGRPVVFELPVTVTDADLGGPDRHVHNVAYVRWIQDAAVVHWRATATPEEDAAYTWVISRHEIDYLRPAHKPDRLVARTHVGKPSGARFDRFVEVVRIGDSDPKGEVLVRARTTWVTLDVRTGRPCRVPAAIAARFFTPLNS